MAMWRPPPLGAAMRAGQAERRASIQPPPRGRRGGERGSRDRGRGRRHGSRPQVSGTAGGRVGLGARLRTAGREDKGREYLVSWWCLSSAMVASREVGQQRRLRGTPGLQRANAAPELVARTLAPGGARPSAVYSPGCGAASGWWRSAVHLTGVAASCAALVTPDSSPRLRCRNETNGEGAAFATLNEGRRGLLGRPVAA
ncbi:unnamed protein product [Miscanthus lutarioriparius]|uniref:Uncharacterized protein n=1 Tax=Miscanthus lutarioriparius TaxID=422564 RepID=A0A811PXG6_9POAL|nr:unnamed protein product [Miscanthus lutarioriparius]